ncbi:MAG: hypothetical protein R2795_19895 [Saprospiraceae bacterium]
MSEGMAGWLLRISFATFATKVLMQTLVVVPFVAEAAYTIRNYVIGFIHLLLLGAVSGFLLSRLVEEPRTHHL